MVRICFVCLGNICRSPTALAVMRALIGKTGLGEHIRVDSAGTSAWHAGEPADERARVAARRRGIELDHRARQFTAADFERFDYVIAMDRDNRDDLLALARTAAARAKVHLLRAFEPGVSDVDVPDPYYGGARGFDEVLDICERACRGLLEHLTDTHGLARAGGHGGGST